MSKVKEEGDSHYEMLYIVPNQYTEDEAKEIATKIKKTITDEGGKITHEEEWGGKKFAYKIKQFTHGYYFVLEFDLDPKKLERINMLIRTSGEIIRFQIISKRVKTAEELMEENKILEKIEAKKAEVAKDEIEKEEAKEKKKPEAKKEKDENKMKLKDLDEKLDELLDTDDLL